MSNIIVSQSEADAFNTCNRKHFYGYSNGGLQRKKMSDALLRGNVGHKVLEVFFKSLQAEGDYTQARETAQDYINSIIVEPNANFTVIADVVRLVNVFWDYWEARISSWTILAIEEEYWLNVTDNIRFPFKPDLLIEENGQKILVDYKFTYDFYSSDMLSLLGQIPKYVGALRALDIFVKKGIYAQLRYRQMKDMSGSNIMRMDDVPLNNARIVRTFKEQVQLTKEIAVYKAMPLEEWDAKATRVANLFTCRMCPFKDLCIAELNGSDGKLMRQIDYEPNTYGYVEDVS